MPKTPATQEAPTRTKQSYVYPCNCKGDKFGNSQSALFQDSTLGKGMRYYTDGGPNSKSSKQRCTVCGRERTRS